ncbi:ClC family H(+)/Cl(-) exchange transporter [Nicoliella spurrieriana]|uniref:ClC family H(+)/Cl(-) exchange transporter n=1 Tax=Nicoliella spurrieriana TaxID=2925830 RepID=A0A976RSJ0_9LACO|nr:ClC family H(+)/Cl(-) exchange transporter [Nicoliella spurrieriana]UQS86965.1 ClC family H(+)/Cl(-) exchange transporter [Nicoliella spurrieriana]
MQKINWRQIAYLWDGVLIGLAVGAVVSLFRWLIETDLAWVKSIYQLAHSNHWWLGLIIAINLLIVLIVGSLIKATPDIKGSGIPQVEGQLANRLDYPFWPVLWKKFIGGVLAIGSGLFLGREGPSIQLGSTTAQGIAKMQGLNGSPRRVAIAAGAAAGLAAAFNAPIASSLFVLEEIYHEFPLKVWPTTLGASIAANLVSTELFGQTPVLHIIYDHPFPINQYWSLILLGILLGIAGIIYQQTTLNLAKFYRYFKGIPNQYLVVLPLLLVIPIGYFLPETLGGGNGLILAIARTVPGIWLLLIYLFVRFCFSAISYGSGVPGGIFLPILTLGAILGALYGQCLVGLHLIPANLVINLIIIAMAAYFACITKSPFTAILLITEMVGTVTHLMSLAVTSLIAYAVVDLLNGKPIYSQMLTNLLQKRR